jgi:hypothetical protein
MFRFVRYARSLSIYPSFGVFSDRVAEIASGGAHSPREIRVGG